jgi:hypothetical protein
MEDIDNFISNKSNGLKAKIYSAVKKIGVVFFSNLLNIIF